MTTRRQQLAAESPDVMIGLFWEPKRKCWTVRAEVRGRLVRLLQIDTAHEIAEAEMYLIASAIKEEMEAWLA